MNLWVKRTGQLLLAALFLMSCEDDSFLLGFKNQNKKFKVLYQEIPLESSIILVDSIVTDNTESPVRFLAGHYTDNMLGDVTSIPFTEYYPINHLLIDETSVLDSVVFKFSSDYYVYGTPGKTTEEFSLHALTEMLNADILNDTLGVSYYYNSNANFDPTPLVTTTQEFDWEQLDENASSPKDTIVLKFSMDNVHPYAQQLFDFIKTTDVETDSTFFAQFRDEFNGLALVPAASNQKILGFNPLSVLSRITVFYHTGADTSMYELVFGTISFNRIITDRSSTELAGTPPYQETSPSDTRYIQAGSPVITQLDLTNYYDFVATIPEMTINSAELSLEPIGVTDGLETPSSLVVRLQNDNNQFSNIFVGTDRERLKGYKKLFLDGRYYAAGSDINITSTTGAVLTMGYNSTSNRILGLATLFLQDLYENKDKDGKITYLSLNAYSPTAGKSVNRVVFNKNSVKLKLYYTVPLSENL